MELLRHLGLSGYCFMYSTDIVFLCRLSVWGVFPRRFRVVWQTVFWRFRLHRFVPFSKRKSVCITNQSKAVTRRFFSLQKTSFTHAQKLQTKTAFAERLQKRCFVKSQSDLPIVIRAYRAQPVFETLFLRSTATQMAALYYYFRLAYKHLLHGNKISLYYRRFLLFFSLALHRTRTAKVLTRHS